MTKNEAFKIAYIVSKLAESAGSGCMPISEMFPLKNLVDMSPKILNDLKYMDLSNDAIGLLKWVGVNVFKNGVDDGC